VIQGDRRGRQLGFPTANIDVDPTSKTLPKEGVYAGLVTIKGDTKAYPAISNWGGRPTFGDNQALLEVHLLDVDENLYGETLTVTFSKRIRNIKRMSSLEALQAQLHEDAMFCRRMYASYFANL
jgi:riboflavin kinase/FMN adenylyltransferase